MSGMGSLLSLVTRGSLDTYLLAGYENYTYETDSDSDNDNI